MSQILHRTYLFYNIICCLSEIHIHLGVLCHPATVASLTCHHFVKKEQSLDKTSKKTVSLGSKIRLALQCFSTHVFTTHVCLA